jgi:hypothetical protein
VEERSSSPLAAIIPKTELCSDATFDDSESLASLPLEESMDEGTPEELQKLMQRQGEKLSLAEINQLKGECRFWDCGKQFHLSRSRDWVDVHLMWQELEQRLQC